MIYLILNSGIYVVRCAIWCHLYNLKNVKSTHGGVLILVQLQAEARNLHKFAKFFVYNFRIYYLLT